MKLKKQKIEDDTKKSKHLKKQSIVSASLQHPENAVLIHDFATLAAIGKTLPLDGYYVQTSDIYFVPDQLKQCQQPPIGSKEQPFTGQYHGNGFKIINLIVLNDRAALFDTVENATIDGIILENAKFIGTGPTSKVASLAIEIKGASHVQNIKWASGNISLQCQTLEKAEIAGIVHTLGKQSLLINAENNGDLIIQAEGKGSDKISIAGIVFYNDGVIKNAICIKSIEGPSVYGIAKVNEGTIFNVKIKDVIGKKFAAGVVEYNKKSGRIENITINKGIIYLTRQQSQPNFRQILPTSIYALPQ